MISLCLGFAYSHYLSIIYEVLLCVGKSSLHKQAISRPISRSVSLIHDEPPNQPICVFDSRCEISADTYQFPCTDFAKGQKEGEPGLQTTVFLSNS